MLSAPLAVIASYPVNSLNLANGGGLTIPQMQTVTLGTASIASGGVLAQDGNAGISGGFVTGGALAIYFHTPTATPANETTINSVITGTAGLNKAGAGTLVLTQTNPYTGTTTINQGTVKLNNGANTLAVGVNATGAALTVNAKRRHYDLNGNVQLMGKFEQRRCGRRCGYLGRHGHFEYRCRRLRDQYHGDERVRRQHHRRECVGDPFGERRADPARGANLRRFDAAQRQHHDAERFRHPAEHPVQSTLTTRGSR